MNVLIVTISFPTIINPINGNFVKELAKCLATKHNVTVLHCSIISNNAPIKPGIYEEKIDGFLLINIFIKNRKLPSSFLTSIGILSGLRHIKKKKVLIDIIHAHFFASAIPFLIVMRKIPLVLTEHWSGFPMKKITTTYLRIAKSVMLRCNIVCPVSKYLKQSIERYGIKANFTIVYNAVDTKFFYYSKKEPRQIKKPLIVARQEPIKGIPNLLKAVSLISKERSDFCLDIVGGGTHMNEYIELSRKLNIAHLVNFHGWKKKEETADFIRNCDFFILSSITENQPVVLNEAICCGKPILATQVGGIPEIVDESIGILVKPNDLNDLGNKLNIMLDNFDKYNHLKIATYGRMLFGCESILTQYDEVYQRIIKTT